MLPKDVRDKIDLARSTHSLDLSPFQHLNYFPDEILTLVNLEKLVWRDTKITSIPKKISLLSKLSYLNLEGNELKVVPKELFSLKNLSYLNLSLKLGAVGFDKMPDQFDQFSQLQFLNLSGHQLSVLPISFGSLHILEQLYLDNNLLTAVPGQLKDLQKLRQLSLTYNKINSLPPWLFELKSLEGLFLIQNEISELPEVKRKNSKLKQLNCKGNQLANVSDTFIRNLVDLKMLDLRENLLSEETVRSLTLETMNPKLIIREIRASREIAFEAANTEPLHQAKVLILGDGDVGKTSLVKRLIGDSFDPNEKTTKGVSIYEWLPAETDASKKLAGVKALCNPTFRIWDFAGQAINHATHQLFLTPNSIYVIVINSRQEQQEKRLRYWLNVIRSYVGKEASIIVAINGIDENPLFLNRRSLDEIYKIQDFIETSSKTNEGINSLSLKILQAAEAYSYFNEHVKLSWKRILDLLPNYMQGHELTYQRFLEHCENRNVESLPEQVELLALMHKVGVTFNIVDDSSSPLILDPNRITQNLYRFQSNPKTQIAQDNDGTISSDELIEILRDIEVDQPEWQILKKLMITNDLCHEMRGSNLILTQLLSKTAPDINLDKNSDKIQFVYQYNFLPESILHRFLGAWLNWKESEDHVFEQFEYWRYGVFFKVKKISLLLKIDIFSNRIDIEIAGESNEERILRLEESRKIMEKIHDRIAYLSVTEYVPITLKSDAWPENDIRFNSYESVSASEPERVFVPYDHLLWLKMMDQDEFYPYGGTAIASVAHLLEGIESIQHIDDHVKFVKNMHKAFNLIELEELCFDMGIDHEDIEGHQVKSSFIRNLYSFVRMRGRREELKMICVKKRGEQFSD